jgi:hypothetical protein
MNQSNKSPSIPLFQRRKFPPFRLHLIYRQSLNRAQAQRTRRPIEVAQRGLAAATQTPDSHSVMPAVF